MLGKFLILATLAIANGMPRNTLSNGCPADFSVHQLLPHPKDCNKFYYCNFGNLVESSCAEGLEFSTWTQTCVQKSFSSCSSRSAARRGTLPNGCPADFSVHQLLPHPKDCNKFFYCNFGDLVESKCAEDLEFSTWTQTCVQKSFSSCSSRSAARRGTLPNGCPADFSVHQLLPHPKDCNKFFYCNFGNLVESKCAEDLEFSTWTQTCVQKSFSSCSSRSAARRGTLPNGCPADFSVHQLLPHPKDCNKFFYCNFGNLVESKCAEDLEFSTWTQTCVQKSFSSCSSRSAARRGTLPNGCPADFSVHQLLPHPKDCNKFFYCNFGDLVESKCAEDLEFSTWTQTCVQKSFSSCSSRSAARRGTLPNGCPADFSVHQLLPHPKDCNKFFYCNFGNLVESKCAEDLEFSTWTQTCVQKSFSSCSSRSAARRGTLPNGCPADFSVHQLLPHPKDCNKFFYCNFGDLVESKCAEDLEFSTWTQTCVQKSFSSCSSRSAARRGTLPNGCPADFSVHQLLPHPKDCNKFFYCNFGNLVESKCAEDLEFSTWTQTCVQKSFSSCSSRSAARSDNLS